MELNEISLATQCGVNEWGLVKKERKKQSLIAFQSQTSTWASSLFPHLLLGFNLLARWLCSASFCHWVVLQMLRWKKAKGRHPFHSQVVVLSPGCIKTRHEMWHCCCCEPSTCSFFNFSIALYTFSVLSRKCCVFSDLYFYCVVTLTIFFYLCLRLYKKDTLINITREY